MKVVKLGLLGLGTVGGGTAQILTQTLSEIERRLGGHTSIKIVQAAVRDLTRARAIAMDGFSLTNNPMDVVNNPEVDIVVEVMGGTGLAKDCWWAAIHNGKHIVTANKALIAEHGNELFALAKAKQVKIAYEAAVAGGIPVIKALREGLAANKIDWLAGIINGTGNYILTEMQKPNADFDAVLKVAQDLGYAEADPTFDVEGIDAAHKLTILASIAFGIPLQFASTYTQGISKITAQDIQYAKQLGYEIKHLGIAARTQAGFSLRVHPTLVPKSVLLAQVSGVMNAVMVKGDHVGVTMYVGPGAGAGPTASAIVADVIDLVRGLNQPGDDAVPALGFGLNQLSDAPVEPIDTIETAYFLRFLAQDSSGVLATVSAILAEANISVEQLHQEPVANSENATIVMVTNRVQEQVMNRVLVKLDALDAVKGSIQKIRVEALGQ